MREATATLPAGPVRDRRAIELVVDVALENPGMVALLLSPVSGPLDGDTPDPVEAGDAVFDAFGIRRAESSERAIRVTGALSALAVLTVSAHQHDRTTFWRPHIVATCLDALGDPRRAESAPDPDHLVEA